MCVQFWNMFTASHNQNNKLTTNLCSVCLRQHTMPFYSTAEEESFLLSQVKAKPILTLY